MGLENWTYNTEGVTEEEDWTEELGDKTYAELVPTGHATFGAGVGGAQRVFLVDFDQTGKFLDDLLGWGQWNGFKIKRVLPDLHPLYRNFYAAKADCRPYGVMSTNETLYAEPIYSAPFMRIEVEYSPVDYDVLDDEETGTEQDRFVSYQYGYQVQLLTLTGGMKFESGAPINQQPAIRSQVQQFQMIWHQVPSTLAEPFKVPTEAKILDLQGKINSAPFQGYDPGTVMFLGCDPKINRPALGDEFGFGSLYTWDLVYSFQVKDEGPSTLYVGDEIGWQYVFDVKNNRWDRLRSIIGGNLPYETGNLNNLFVP